MLGYCDYHQMILVVYMILDYEKCLEYINFRESSHESDVEVVEEGGGAELTEEEPLNENCEGNAEVWGCPLGIDF